MSDFELIRDSLLRFDPETRHHLIEAMMILRALPRPVAVRILASAYQAPTGPLVVFPP